VPSLCCFWCPSGDFSERKSDEPCPTCARRYDAPLTSPPARINSYTVEEPLTRGFYGAVYRARQTSLDRRVVLKVVSKAVYAFFGKDWARECREHAAIAEGSPFVANITEQFDADVLFGATSTPCHVAVLEDIPGSTLEHTLASPGESGLTPRMAGQIAADMFEILNLFISRDRSHNDLHAGNIMVARLPPATRRSEGIDPGVRAVAIDMGSVLDASQSGDHHIGDQHHIARHLLALTTALRTLGPTHSDQDYRFTGALRGLAEHLTPDATSQRVMTPSDALRLLRSALSAVDEPWRLQLSLQRYGDAYNAQALESWHVPELWIDPSGRWLRKTTARGPQVITGMRGCGKTMLVRALHFHARAARLPEPGESAIALDRLKADGFLGLFASCQKLLNPLERRNGGNDAELQPFERLYVAYLRDAVQVLRHLRSLAPDALLGSVNDLLRDALSPLGLNVAPGLIGDEQRFDQFLMTLQFALDDGSSDCRLKVAPAEAFAVLAAVVCAASPILTGKYVLFLLDDVSTRYLRQDTVRTVISRLLFQHPRCAFRITTEAQTLHRVLLSPGGGAPADPLRDYEEINLGYEVYRLLQQGSNKESTAFISELLRRRGRTFNDALYRAAPRRVLGDSSLEDIAKAITSSSATSAERKRVYHGLRAIQAACVGDLGDVVKLYEKILQRASIDNLPVPQEIQTDCFLEHSASLMHFLNRRDQRKKGLALAFAQAAGELLQRSAKTSETTTPDRLRQYTKLYVRVESGRESAVVANKILELLDAGVFVYDGGGPRTKTRDDDPVLQFKLSYRKMLGLASFLGLADRDRFELSGNDLRRWLDHPGEARAILVESEVRRGARSPDTLDDTVLVDEEFDLLLEAMTSGEASLEESPHDPQRAVQGTFAFGDTPPTPPQDLCPVPSLNIQCEQASLSQWSLDAVDTLVLARGFEDRALVSAERVLATIRPRRIILIKYAEDEGIGVAQLVEATKIPHTVVAGIPDLKRALSAARGNVILDASGLWKPYLFVAVRDILRSAGHVSIVHTLAEHYYPRNEDIANLGLTAGSAVPSEFFGRLAESTVMGEAGPYNLVRVHDEPASPERWRAVLASASAKNDRLLHLLDERDYDAARIFVPPPTSPRRRLARAATELVASAADSNVGLLEVDTNDIAAALAATNDVYSELYFRSGANVEIGLTGSKVHAVAFAALAAAARVSAVWYVEPTTMDRERFTQGAAGTHCFDIRIG